MKICKQFQVNLSLEKWFDEKITWDLLGNVDLSNIESWLEQRNFNFSYKNAFKLLKFKCKIVFCFLSNNCRSEQLLETRFYWLKSTELGLVWNSITEKKSFSELFRTSETEQQIWRILSIKIEEFWTTRAVLCTPCGGRIDLLKASEETSPSIMSSIKI